MFKFLNRWKQAEQSEVEQSKAVYLDLISKAAKAGDLADADATKLKAAADKLGYTAEKITADIEVLETVRKLEPEAALLDTRRAESKRLGREVNERDAERIQAKADFERAYGELTNARVDAQNAVGAAMRAAETVADLRQKHPDLFPASSTAPAREAQPAAV